MKQYSKPVYHDRLMDVIRGIFEDDERSEQVVNMIAYLEQNSQDYDYVSDLAIAGRRYQESDREDQDIYDLFEVLNAKVQILRDEIARSSPPPFTNRGRNRGVSSSEEGRFGPHFDGGVDSERPPAQNSTSYYGTTSFFGDGRRTHQPTRGGTSGGVYSAQGSPVLPPPPPLPTNRDSGNRVRFSQEESFGHTSNRASSIHPSRPVSPVSVTDVVDLTELKADIAPKANQGSFEAEYNKYKKHFDDFLAYFEKQSKTDFYSSRLREDLKFYTIDDSGYKQDLAAKIFAQQIDEVRGKGKEPEDFIRKHFMSTIIGSNDMDDFSHIYNTYEKILQETELGYTPVQMLLDLSDNFISKYKEQYLKVLDKAIEDNTFSVNGPSEPYITVENLPDILDKLIAYKHNRGIELLFKSENFVRLLFDQDSQAEVKTVLKTRISNGTLRKALGDSFEQTIIDVAEEFNDKNKETILKALSNKKDRNNDRDDDRSSNRRRDESKEEVPESTNFFENTESASSKEFSLISDTSKTTVGVGTVTIIAFAILTALAAVGTGGTALIAAAVLAPVVGGIATVASVKNDKVEFQAEQLNKATNKIHSAYQDRGQHPADSRKGPPYAERAENGRSADRSKGGYSR